jgi:prepilin-type N-terminal cleavage/methylation domain-containing protein
MIRPQRRPGVTLIELIAVLAVLGIIGTVVALTIRSTGLPGEADQLTASIARARRDALRFRHPVSIEIGAGPFIGRATAMPDGRVVADSEVGGLRMTAITNGR